MSFVMSTPQEIQRHVAKQARAKRLSLNLSQKSLSEKSGVSYGVLKKFETSGAISLESLLKLAFVLDAIDDFEELFKPIAPEQRMTLDELLKDKTRKRGRE